MRSGVKPEQNLEALLAAGLLRGSVVIMGIYACCCRQPGALCKAFLKKSSSIPLLSAQLAGGGSARGFWLAYLVGMLTNNTNALQRRINTVSWHVLPVQNICCRWMSE